MGARSAYSALNGFFWILIVVGGLAVPIARFVPIEAGAAIVVWIAIIITAQAFQATPKEHAPAVAFRLFPALAAWVVIAMGTGLRQAGVTPDAGVIEAIDDAERLRVGQRRPHDALRGRNAVDRHQHGWA